MEDLSHSTSTLSNKEVVINGDDEVDEKVVKVKTSVSLLQEMCVAFKLGLPRFELKDEVGEAHLKTFTMVVSLKTLGLEEFGIAKTKMQAKHNAADQIMAKIKAAAANQEGLNVIPYDTLLKCSNMLNSSTLANENPPQLECSNAAGKLKEWTLMNDMEPPLYELVEAIGPSHSRIFCMKCTMLEHTTQGEGKSKKIAKNIAADKMLQLLHLKQIM